jgi:hypothetical protein
LNADRIILAIQTEKCLNDLIGVQHDNSNTEYIREDSLQSWHTRTISNCNLVELPHSVSDLLIKSDNRVFNFLEAMNTNNLRKEIETCLPITFQFWSIPKFRKLLDEKISLLIFGGNLLKEIDNDNSSNQGLVSLLLTIVKLIRQIPFMCLCHFSRDFSKDDLVDFNLDKLCNMTLEQRNKFLIEEFEYLMSEMNCSDEYIMDLFVSDIMRVDYVVEKVWYRKRRNFLLI